VATSCRRARAYCTSDRRDTRGPSPALVPGRGACKVHHKFSDRRWPLAASPDPANFTASGTPVDAWSQAATRPGKRGLSPCCDRQPLPLAALFDARLSSGLWV